MRRNVTAPGLLGIVALALFTIFFTWKAKLLEKNFLERNEASAQVNKEAADFTLPALNGQAISLADYRGKKKVVVSFWASWCGPCRLELAQLTDFYKKYHKNNSDFEILAISIDEDRGAAEAYASREKFPFPVLLDPGNKAADAYSVEAIPSLFVVDSKGTVAFGNTGMDQALEVQLAVQLGIDLNLKKPGAADDSSRN